MADLKVNMYVGIFVEHAGDPDQEYWQITCPCGITVGYPLNGLPAETTKHPCNHRLHYTIMYHKEGDPLECPDD